MVLLFLIFITPYVIPGQRKKKDSPFDILKMRFASGEIDKEEYEEKKRHWRAVNPNKELSLHYHHNHDESWRELDGGSIIIGNDIKTGKKGDKFFILRETKQQIKTAASSVAILDISLCDFDEEDIVRVKDSDKRN